MTKTSHPSRRRRHGSITVVVAACTLAASRVAVASPAVDDAEHRFARARWSIVAGDTLAAIDALRGAWELGPTEETRARIAVLLRLFDGPQPLAAVDVRTDAARAWTAALSRPSDPTSIDPDTPAALRMVQAARAIDAGDAPTARAALRDLRVDAAFESLLLHLRARTADLDRDAESALRWRRELLQRGARGDADAELVAAAAFALADHALAAGDANGAIGWLGHVPATSAHAARAALARVAIAIDHHHEGDHDDPLATWIQDHPTHPLVDEARARRIDLALERGDPATARTLALARRADLDTEHERWRTVLEDEAALARISTDAWRHPSDAAVALDRESWRAALVALGRGLAEAPARWTSLEEALRPRPIDAAVGTADVLRIDESFRARDRAYADSLDVAARALARARRDRDELLDELDSRTRLRRRGLDAKIEVGGILGATRIELDDLARRAPGLLEDLRSLEDSLLVRIDRRSRALGRRAQHHADHAAMLRWIYVEGPMARRDPAPHEAVPTPRTLVDREETIAREAGSLLDSLRVRSTETVRRSFSDVFTRRVTTGLDGLLARTRELHDRTDTLGVDIATELARLADDPRRTTTDALTLAAQSRWERLHTARAQARLAATRAAIDLRCAALENRREGVLYALALATTELGTASRSEHGDDPGAALRAEARELWAELLALDPDPRVRPDARYRWADLELTAAQERFQARMGDWLDQGDAETRALAPLLDIEPALVLLRAILDEDPGFDRRDLVLFHLGMLEADRGDATARGHLERLVEQHPASPVVQHAQLRLGELAFDAGDPARAAAHLRVAATGDDHDVRAVALYKLGWSANAIGDAPLAIDAFLRLVDLHDDPATAPTRFELGDEARGLLLRSMARDGGAASFARTFDAHGERPWAPELLDDLAVVLDGHALADPAIDAERLMIDRYPLHPLALTAAERWITTEERERGGGAADAVRLQVFERFAVDGSWAQAQTADSLRTRGDAFARSSLLTVAVRRHREARESGRTADYDGARDLYERLLLRWPGDVETAQWHLLAGECARATGAWAIALDHVTRAGDGHGEVAARAAWEKVATADAWYRSSIPDGASAGADSLARRLMAIGDAHHDDDPQRAADLQWRLVQIALAHGFEDEVAARSIAFAQTHRDDARAVRALVLRAESSYRTRAFDRASADFERAHASAVAAHQDSLATALTPWIAHSAELHAESVSEDPQQGPATAAPLWRSFAARWPDADGADRALYRAGLGFVEADSIDAALESWTTLVERHPTSSFAPDAQRNVALQLEARGDAEAAARALETYADRFAQADDAGDVLLHAAELFGRSGAAAERTRLLDRHLAAHPEDVDTRQWVLEERAQAELDAGGPGIAVRAFEDFAQEHPERASTPLLARLSLMRADARRVAYEAIVLDQPLTASLERKRDALGEVLDAYRRVAERGVAPYAQAAAHHVGGALVHMSEALLASERPAGLEGDDLVAYDEVIESQAWTFAERGEEAWRELLRTQADSADVEVRVWVASTRAALFPRTARRFLHRPSFDYPVLGDASAAR